MNDGTKNRSVTITPSGNALKDPFLAKKGASQNRAFKKIFPGSFEPAN